MERTLLAWNLPNMVTVPLMVILAFLILGILTQLWRGVMSGNMMGADGASAA